MPNWGLSWLYLLARHIDRNFITPKYDSRKARRLFFRKLLEFSAVEQVISMVDILLPPWSTVSIAIIYKSISILSW